MARAKGSTKKDWGAEPAEQVTNVGGQDPEEKVLVHCKEYHNHGVCGVLEEGMLYRMPRKHFEQIDEDYPGKLVAISEEDAKDIADANRKRRVSLINRRKKEQEKREAAELKAAGKAADVG